MISYGTANVNTALAWGVYHFQQLEQDKRNIIAPRGQRTLEFPTPVTTTYYRPNERVLFSPLRDANPFFHFFEALWMLNGRNDLTFPQKFNKNFSDYSDNGQTVWGAYGWRWRDFFGMDQLEAIISLLRNDPTSRRAVLQMWAPDGDLIPYSFTNEGGLRSKDIPCNTCIYFKIRDGLLNMTVSNRSNDMIWGAYGANAVHMSMLHEYMAEKLNVKMGVMRQVSDSFHVYLDGRGGELWAKLRDHRAQLENEGNPYDKYEIKPYPMGSDNMHWDASLEHFFELVDAGVEITHDEFLVPYFSRVVVPLWRAWHTRDPEELIPCLAVDWRVAASEWLERRKK